MRYVLGMSKRNLDLKGVKPIRIELDFLRLVYVVQRLRQGGDEAQGYLLVMTDAIAKRARGWIEKYDAGDTVEILVPKLTQQEQAIIEAEIAGNVEGMVSGTLGTGDSSSSDASTGGHIGEDHLDSLMREREAGVAEITDSAEYPLGIQWDFFGCL